MPKIIVHAPESALALEARQAIAGELTEFSLGCERLPKSPFLKSTVWTYFNLYRSDCVFMGANAATADVISVQIYVIEGGLDHDGKKDLVKGVTAIFGAHITVSSRVPVYIVIHEVPENNWGIFGVNANLAALRASALDAPAM